MRTGSWNVRLLFLAVIAGVPPAACDDVGAPPGLETTTFQVGPEGGTFSDQAGLVTLTFPVGSVTNPVEVTMAQAPGTPANSGLIQWTPFTISTAPDVAPTTPVSMTVRYQGHPLPNNLLVETVGLFRAVGSQWAPLPSDGDAEARSVSAEIAQFGTFGLIGRRLGSLTSASGTSLVAQTATEVDDPPTVVALDLEGEAIEGLPIQFRVTAGGGTVEPRLVATDANGRASVTRWVLGPNMGSNTVEASITSDASVDRVVFQAEGTGEIRREGFLFASDWSTDRGRSEDAVRDTDQVYPWTSWNRFGTSPSLLDVVPADDLGFPSTMDNVLRVRQEGDQAAEDVRLGDAEVGNHFLPAPVAGEHRYYRVYVRYGETTPSGGPDHGLQAFAFDCAFSWAWKVAAHPEGFGVLWQHDRTPDHRWYVLDALLERDHVYRLEWHHEFRGQGRFKLDVRIHDQDGEIVYDDRHFDNADAPTGHPRKRGSRIQQSESGVPEESLPWQQRPAWLAPTRRGRVPVLRRRLHPRRRLVRPLHQGRRPRSLQLGRGRTHAAEGQWVLAAIEPSRAPTWIM